MLQGKAWPANSTKMDARIREFDWAATELGPVHTWPHHLRATVELMLSHGFPMIVLWGPKLIQIYNDGYAVILGDKHPGGLGQPTSECWPEVWHINEPIYARVREGKTLTFEDKLYPIAPRGVVEDTWFTITYSPLSDDTGAFGGVLVTMVDTTARQLERFHRERAENELRQSEMRARTLVEGIAQAFWETNGEGVVVEDSVSWRTYTGQTLSEWLGYGWLDAVHPDDRALAESSWRHAVQHTGHVDAEYRIRTAAGRWRWTNVRAAPLLGENGSVLKWVGINIDIDARKRAEAEVRTSEDRQTFLLRLSDAMRPLVDASLIQERAAEMLSRQLGVDSAFYYDLDVEDDVAIPRRGHAGANPHPGRTTLSEFGDVAETFAAGHSLIHSDNERDPRLSESQRAAFRAIGVRAVVGVPMIKRGRVEAALGVHHSQPRLWSDDDLRLIHDVAERTWAAVERARAEESLQRSESRYRTLFEQVQEGFCVIEKCSAPGELADFMWIEGNPAFMSMASRPDLIGRRMRTTFPDDALDAIDIFDRVLTSGAPVQFEYTMPTLGRTFELNAFRSSTHGQVAVLFQDITERKRAQLELASAEQRQRALVEGIPQLVWRAQGRGEWTWTSPQWTAYTGQSEADSLDLGWLHKVHPHDHERVHRAWAVAAEAGGFELDYRICHARDGAYRWFRTRAAPVLDDAGEILEWLGTSTDVDEMRSLQERQDVLVAELQHRTRNLMGVINAIAEKTGLASRDLGDFRTRLRDRLDALARVQGLLSRLNEHDRVTFDELVQTELSAMSGDSARVVLQGPQGVRLRSSTVQTLAMALHELATNAVKYGALAQPQGRLVVMWRVAHEGANADTPWLHIDWRESGVRVAKTATAGRGQGRELIERALPYQFNAKTNFALGETGVHCTIAIPVSTHRAPTLQ